MMRSFTIMKPGLIILLLSGMLLTGACKKITYHQLTDEDMTWLVYKNNQIDYFTNGSNQTVSYLVTLRTKSYNDNDGNANEFTTAAFKLRNDTTAIESEDSNGLLYIFKPDDDGLVVTLSWPHFPLKEVPLTSQTPNTVTVGGINYADVFILDATGLTDIRFYIREIWYSKSEGVIQYEDASGDIWVRN